MKTEHEVKWSISDVKTTEGETMIVGGIGQEFGLIAVVTDESDAKQIIADREARTGAPEPLDHLTASVIKDMIKQHVGAYADDDRVHVDIEGFDEAASAIFEQVRSYAVAQAMNWQAEINRMRPQNNVFEFGIGMLAVETGEYGGQHCVFVSRNKIAGPVGELQPGQNGPVTLDAVPDDWLVFQFASRERVVEVYNALCGIGGSQPAVSSDWTEPFCALRDRWDEDESPSWPQVSETIEKLCRAACGGEQSAATNAGPVTAAQLAEWFMEQCNVAVHDCGGLADDILNTFDVRLAAPTTSPEPPFDLAAFQKEAATWETVESEQSTSPEIPDNSAVSYSKIPNNSNCSKSSNGSPEPDAVRESIISALMADGHFANSFGTKHNASLIAKRLAGNIEAALSRPAHGGWEELRALFDAVGIYQFSPTGAVESSHAARDLDDAMDAAKAALARNQGQGGGPR